MKFANTILIVFLITTVLAACKREKEPIRYGTDVCDHCKMLAMDPHFGAEIMTSKGKIFKFDDINCMLAFVNDPMSNPGVIAETYVIDYSQPQTLIPAATAFYVQSDLIKSPMASGIAAFATDETRYEQQQTWQGTELNWGELKTKLK